LERKGWDTARVRPIRELVVEGREDVIGREREE
jgi:hypothetical protein